MGQQQFNINCGYEEQQKKNQLFTTPQQAISLIKQNNAAKNHNISVNNQNNQKQSLSQKILQHQNIQQINLKTFENCINQNGFYIENSSNTLAKIIQKRFNTNMYFPPLQIIQLLQSLVYSLAYLFKKNINYHDFYPTNIFYQNNKFKIKHPYFVNQSGYQLTKIMKRFSFLSPQLIDAALENINQKQIDSQILNKSDVFAIGMVMLQFCSLKPSAQCYDEQNYSIIDQQIKIRLQITSQLYSLRIKQCLSYMLEYDGNKRPGIMELAMNINIQSQKQKVQINKMIKSSNEQKEQLVHNKQPPLNSSRQIKPDNVVLPTPYQIYSRIGPNNQGLLSPTTLQNKLRVIESIHEIPNEEDDEDIKEENSKIVTEQKQHTDQLSTLSTQDANHFHIAQQTSNYKYKQRPQQNRVNQSLYPMPHQPFNNNYNGNNKNKNNSNSNSNSNININSNNNNNNNYNNSNNHNNNHNNNLSRNLSQINNSVSRLPLQAKKYSSQVNQEIMERKIDSQIPTSQIKNNYTPTVNIHKFEGNTHVLKPYIHSNIPDQVRTNLTKLPQKYQAITHNQFPSQKNSPSKTHNSQLQPPLQTFNQHPHISPHHFPTPQYKIKVSQPPSQYTLKQDYIPQNSVKDSDETLQQRVQRILKQSRNFA